MQDMNSLGGQRFNSQSLPYAFPPIGDVVDQFLLDRVCERVRKVSDTLRKRACCGPCKLNAIVKDTIEITCLMDCWRRLEGKCSNATGGANAAAPDQKKTEKDRRARNLPVQ